MHKISLPIVDCRPASLYQQGHIKDSVNIPAEQLSLRLFELPAKHQAINLAGDKPSLTSATKILHDKGFNVVQCIELNPETISHYVIEKGGNHNHLWQAAAVVKNLLALQADIKTGLDIASGSGRDAVFLAMQGIQMTAIDNKPSALLKAQQLADIYQTTIEFKALDVRYLRQQLTQSFDLVLSVRFLHRPLLAELDSFIKPGGFIAYQTFMQGAERFAGPKNPNRLLKPGELAACFAHYTIMLDRVEHLPDGRPMGLFIAQKPIN